MPKIYCLFTIANQYDQPSNNLGRWWTSKPTIEQLADAVGGGLSKISDDEIAMVVSIWQGNRVQWHPGGTTYRLQAVAEGEVLATD